MEYIAPCKHIIVIFVTHIAAKLAFGTDRYVGCLFVRRTPWSRMRYLGCWMDSLKNLVGCFPITLRECSSKYNKSTKNEFQNNTHTQGEREEISIDIHKIA